MTACFSSPGRCAGTSTRALEAEVVGRPRCAVPLHDGDRPLPPAACRTDRLRRFLAASLALVVRELLAHRGVSGAFCRPPVVCLPFTQPLHGGDKPPDG